MFIVSETRNEKSRQNGTEETTAEKHRFRIYRFIYYIIDTTACVLHMNVMPCILKQSKKSVEANFIRRNGVWNFGAA